MLSGTHVIPRSQLSPRKNSTITIVWTYHLSYTCTTNAKLLSIHKFWFMPPQFREINSHFGLFSSLSGMQMALTSSSSWMHSSSQGLWLCFAWWTILENSWLSVQRKCCLQQKGNLESITPLQITIITSGSLWHSFYFKGWNKSYYYYRTLYRSLKAYDWSTGISQ